MIYSNTEIKSSFRTFLKDRYSKLDQMPSLHVLSIGADAVSQTYINHKQIYGGELGIKVIHQSYSDSTSENEIESYIHNIPSGDGLIIQLPVKEKYKKIVANIPYRMDVDLLSYNSTLLLREGFLPPTIGAIDLVLKNILWKDNPDFPRYIFDNIDFAGMSVAIIGQGNLVGRPLLQYFTDRNATIISINEFTKCPSELSKHADIVICGAGKPGLVSQSWLKENVIVIDAATSESNGKIIGDVNKGEIHESTMLCPSPGGIGPITVSYLFWNLYMLSVKKMSQN